MHQKIYDKVDELKEELIGLGKNIHENPELSFEEYESSKFCMELLKEHGFEVEREVGGLPTAFKARFKGKDGGKTLAFLAEYDALPEMGHACGHNLIAMTSVGAAISLSKFMGDILGEIQVIGTPAEENGGGKIILLEQGVFEDVDYALMTHPGTKNLINRGGLATTGYDIKYIGEPVHSAYPEGGINALQAVIQTFNLIDSVRAKMPLKANVNGIITEGGIANNIIPGEAACSFSVRADTFSDLKKIIDLINDVVKSVEVLTGAKAEVEIGRVYAERYSNLVIDELYKKHFENFGATVYYPDPNAKYGSSDIGNVSLEIPAIHAYIKIADDTVKGHTLDFTKASNSEEAYKACLNGAKALAASAYEILTDKSIQEEIAKEFEETVPVYESLEL